MDSKARVTTGSGSVLPVVVGVSVGVAASVALSAVGAPWALVAGVLLVAVGFGVWRWAVGPVGGARLRPVVVGGATPALAEDRHAPLDLTADGATGHGAVGTLVFGLAWNAWVGVFAVSSWRDDGFAVLCLSPFLLVGLAFLARGGYLLLASMNPRPSLVLSKCAPAPGEEVELMWRFDGDSGRIRRLRVDVVGQEWVRYVQGTDTLTDTKDFWTENLVTTEDPATIANGVASFRVPWPSMPTWSSANNAVRWRILVRGDVPRWPDVDHEFPIIVAALVPGGDQ